jgi:hypothetical protein
MTEMQLPSSVAYALVAASNIVYFLIAAWLWSSMHDYYAIVLFLVGVTSIVFHLVPSNHVAYYTDIVVACASIAWLTVVYLHRGKYHDPAFIALSLLLFFVATYFFFETGTHDDIDRTTVKYVYTHSLWHILSAAALYFLVKSVRN